jgi:DNA polymerase III alpha subunit (gram-positive type)
MNYFIAFDTETGGIGLDKSLLTAYFAFLEFDTVNKKFKLLNDLDLKIKPDDGVYKVTAEAMSINKIDLIAHDKVAIFQKLAGQILYKKIKEWHTIANTKLIPVGHRIQFDINRVTNDLVSLGSWENFVSYREIDTCSLAQFYRLMGKLPSDISCSLGHLSAYFKVIASGQSHEAKYDTLATIGVLENLMKLA